MMNDFNYAELLRDVKILSFFFVEVILVNLAKLPFRVDLKIQSLF